MQVLAGNRNGERKQVDFQPKDGAVLTMGEIGMQGTYPDGKPIEAGYGLVRCKGDDVFVTVPEGSRGKIGSQSIDEARAAGAFRTQKGIDIIKVGQDAISVELGEIVIKFKPAVAAAASAPKSAPAPAAAASKPAATAPKTKGGSMSTNSAGGQGHSRPQNETMNKRSPIFVASALFVFLLHLGFFGYLTIREVPEDLYDDPTKIPERFVKLIVDEVPEEEPEVEAEEAAAEIPTETGDEEEEASEESEDGGGGEDVQTEAQSREEKRENVRTKGVLALITSSGGGGALADVLGDGALGDGLDSALNDVNGVGVAGAGVDVRKKRGGGGAGKAGIGNLNAGSGRKGGLGTKKRKKVVAAIKTEAFAAKGALSQEAIRAVMQKNIRKIKSCYDRELAKDPELKGKVEVQFKIDGEGRVKDYKIKSSTMKNATVEGCILKRIRRFKFPKPSEGEVKVVYPFVFITS